MHNIEKAEVSTILVSGREATISSETSTLLIKQFLLSPIPVTIVSMVGG